MKGVIACTPTSRLAKSVLLANLYYHFSHSDSDRFRLVGKIRPSSHQETKYLKRQPEPD